MLAMKKGKLETNGLSHPMGNYVWYYGTKVFRFYIQVAPGGRDAYVFFTGGGVPALWYQITAFDPRGNASNMLVTLSAAKNAGSFLDVLIYQTDQWPGPSIEALFA
jgi:hypothetical protein